MQEEKTIYEFTEKTCDGETKLTFTKYDDMYITDALEMFKGFLNAIGYTYISEIVAISEEGNEFSTES